MNFSAALLRWYKKHKRDLPWRKTKDPYVIWLSEIILQQTRVNQGLPYFLKFVKQYPTVQKLADAKLQSVLKLWQGLGYYSRVRNMHYTAKEIKKRHNGIFPNEYTELLKLKGVGEYTAAAIASICFGKPHPVIDGNAARVLSRYFGMKLLPDSSSAKKKYTAAAYQLMGKYPPADFNQAVMEFGALQCVPKNPDCSVCPFIKSCFAFNHNQVQRLPVKKIKPKIRRRYFDYLVIQHKKKIYLRKRTEDDIWKNLFDFPVIESKKFLSHKLLMKSAGWKKLLGNCDYDAVSSSRLYRHQLSHQHLSVRFWKIIIQKNSSSKDFNKLVAADSKTVNKYPIPRLIEHFLEENKIFDN